MKAVCVLKGDGPVKGIIRFEQKARPGTQAAVTRHTCAGARHAPAAA